MKQSVILKTKSSLAHNENNKRSLKLKIMMEYIQAKAYLDKKAKAKERKLRLFSVVFSFLCGGEKKPKQTCKNCRFNCEDDHTCMNDCNVGSYYAEKGLNRICYEGELWESK